MTHAEPPCILMALTGGSGSGKSTVAEALTEALGPACAVIVREDDYYWPAARYGPVGDDAARRALALSIDYDRPDAKEVDLLARQLAALKAGERVNAPVYDYARHDRAAETLAVTPAPLIILEGIHALSMPAVRPLFDLKVYVDTPDDLRLARRLRRDVVERGRDVELVLGQYLGTVRPAFYRYTFPAKFEADLVIADEGLPAYGDVRPSEEAIRRMVAPILDRLARMGLAPA